MFRTRLRELREAAGYKTQQAFADAFGVAQSTVGNWEAGKREPSNETAERLADFLNVTVDYLFGRIEKLHTFPRSEWTESEIEDYQKLKNDDERRRMLSISGYDKEREKDAMRLFPEQFAGLKKQNISVFSEPVENVVEFPIIASVSAGYNGLAVEEYTDDVETLPYSMLRGYPPEELRVLRVAGESMYPRFLDGDKVLIHVQCDVDDGDVAVVIYDGDSATLKQFFHIDGGVRLVAYNPEYPPKTITGADAELVHVFGKVLKLIRDV